MFFKIGVLKNFANFTGKHLCWSLFLINLQAFRSATLLNKDSNTGVILWNLQNISKLFFSQNTILQCLLLCVLKIWQKFQSRIISKHVLAGNNFIAAADVPVGIFRNNIHSCFCCFHELFEILNYTIFMQYCE